jgi:hypothetical protein
VKKQISAFLLIFFIFTGVSFAKEVSALKILDLLSYRGFGELKYKGGGESPNLDVSDWETKYISTRWPTPFTNVWFRTTIDIPENCGGFDLTSRDLTLHLNMDNGDEVFVNGKLEGKFDRANGHYVIAKNIQPGDRYVVAVRGINKIGWGHLIAAQVDISGIEDFQQQLLVEVEKLFAAKRMAFDLTKRPTYWDEHFELLADRVVKSNAFQGGDQQETNLIERKLLEIKPREKTFKCSIKPYEIRSFKVSLK